MNNTKEYRMGVVKNAKMTGVCTSNITALHELELTLIPIVFKNPFGQLFHKITCDYLNLFAIQMVFGFTLATCL